MTYIFMDAETIPDNLDFEEPVKPTVEDMKVGNIKEENKLKIAKNKLTSALGKWEIEKQIAKAKAVKYHSLHALKARIICLSYALNDEDPVCLSGSEQEIMLAFDKVVAKTKSNFVMVAYNGKEFDFNLLALRSFLYDCPFLKQQFYKLHRGDDRFLDLAEVFTFFSFKTYFSLDEILKYFGIPTSKGEMDGSKVYECFLAGELKKIIKYCNDDVIGLRRLYKLYERKN